MFRMLFFKELRRSVVSTLLVFLVVFGSLTVLEQIYPLLLSFFQLEPRAPLGLSNFFPVLLVFCAFGLGIGAFPKKLKETHFAFLQSLPLGRRRIWLAIVLGHLFALLASIPVVPALAPKLLQKPVDAILIGLLFPIVAFSAGCCFALLLRRTIFAFGAGTLICMVLFLQMVMSILPYVPAPPTTDPSLEIFAALVPLGLMALVFSALSCHFFVAGDFPHGRQRLRNWTVFVLGFTAFFTVARAHTTAWLISGGRWERGMVEVSGNGKRLCLVEGLAGRPRFCRVRVLDCDTGELLAEQRMTVVHLVAWSATGDIVTVYSVDRPWLGISILQPGKPLFDFAITRLGPAPGQRARKLFEDEVPVEVIPAGAGRLLAVTETTDRILVLRYLDAGTWAETEVLRTTDPYWTAHLWPVGDQIFVDLPNSKYTEPAVAPRAWLLGTAARELRSLPLPVDGDTPSYRSFLVHDTVYRTRQEAAAALLGLSPPPPGSGPLVPVISGGDHPEMGASAEETAVFALGQGQLLAFRKSDRSWSRLAELAPLAGVQPSAEADPLWIEGKRHLRDRFHADLLPAHGLAVFLAEEGSEVQAQLHDAHSETSLKLGPVGEIPVQRSAVGIRKVNGLDGFLVDLCPLAGDGPTRLYRYLPGSGRLDELSPSPAAAQDILYLAAGGRQIYSDPASGGIFVLDPGQPPRRLGP